MPEIVYYVAASADGFIATPDGGVEWLAPFEGGPDDYGYAEFLAGVEAILMGSATFEQSLTFGEWPYEGIPTHVFSHRALGDLPADVTVTAASPAEVVAQLERAGVTCAWLVGGGELAGSFARAGLISRYIVSSMPVLLGDGVRLLGSQGAAGRLVLESSARIGDVIQNTYRAAG